MSTETNPSYSFYKSTKPRWAGDPLDETTLLRVLTYLDRTKFPAVDAVSVRITTNTAADQELVPVDALKNPIPAGAVIPLGAANSKKFLLVKTAAAKGAVQLAVQPLATAVVANDKGTYLGIGKKSVPSGTLLGRTFAEREAGLPWSPADLTTHNEFFLMTRDLPDLSKDNTTELYRHNAEVKINYLPGYANFSNDFKAKIESLYTCVIGKN